MMTTSLRVFVSSIGGRAELVIVDVHKNTQEREAHVLSVKANFPIER